MKTIIIARVSTEEQKEAGLSLPAQIARLEKYCQNKGFKIVERFCFDESAYKDQRHEFDKILDFILEQTEKLIVCCDKVDRLSRNFFDKRISMLYDKALTDAIELHFVSDGQVINSQISAAEKFQFGISLSLAKYYSDAISDNVKRAIEQKLQKGEWPARAPYGYQNVLIEGRKEIIYDEYAARIVHKAFELYATKAFSLASLCEKIKRDHNLTWSASYLDKIFDNPFYYGVMRINSKLYPHKYQPIVSKSLFDEVQQVQASFEKKKIQKLVGRPYAYRGMIRCAICDLAITPEKQKGFVYYHCTQFKGKHNASWFREEVLDEQLAQVFKCLELSEAILEETLTTL